MADKLTWAVKRDLDRMVQRTRRGTDTFEPAPPRPPQGSITRTAESKRKRDPDNG